MKKIKTDQGTMLLIYTLYYLGYQTCSTELLCIFYHLLRSDHTSLAYFNLDSNKKILCIQHNKVIFISIFKVYTK